MSEETKPVEVEAAERIARRFVYAAPGYAHGSERDLAVLVLDLAARLRVAERWREATVPIIATLALYGERANVEALVKKARALNKAPARD